MDKKTIRKKSKYYNIYSPGGALTNLYNWNNKVTNNFMKSNIGKRLGNIGVPSSNLGLGGIINTGVSTLNSLMNPSGNQTGVGNALSTVGSIASNIPGIGGIIGAGVNLIGGLVNSAFGSNINEEFVEQVKDKIEDQRNYVSGASDNTSLLSDWSSYTDMSHVKQDDVGSEGWFSDKAKDLTRDLNKKIDEANFRAWNSLVNTADNIDTQNDLNILANFSAYGGPIDWDNTLEGKLINYVENRDSVGWDSKSKRWYAPPKNKGYDTENRGMGVDIVENPHIKGKIKVDKKGSYLTVKDERDARFKSLDDALESYNRRLEYTRKVTKSNKTPSNKKRAITMSAIYNLGSTEVANTLFEDSKLMDALMNGTDKEYADKVHKYYKKKARNERIDLENKFLNLKSDGGVIYTKGGIFDNGIISINEGKTHEENPMNGVPMGIDPSGVPNLVEEGEVIFDNYVFSNRIKVPDTVRSKYKLKGNKGLTFADAAKQMQKESEERPNDPISKRGLLSSMSKLQQAQETVRQQAQEGQEGVQYAHGGRMGILFDGLGDMPNFLDGVDYGDWQDYGSLLELINAEDLWNESKAGADGEDTDNSSKLSWLRYAPVVGTAIGLGQNIFSNPDYSSPDAILDAAYEAGRYTPVGFRTVGNYLEYKPLDRNYYINKLNAQAGAARRAIHNTSGGNRATAMAGILASDYNTQGRLGDLVRQAEEYNLAQRQTVENFNRATNMYNAEMGLKAAMANQAARQSAINAKMSGIEKAVALKEAIDEKRNASISANLTNLFDSLGDIGKEEYIKDMIERSPHLLYDWLGNYKGRVGAKGGYLTIKNRRR